MLTITKPDLADGQNSKEKDEKVVKKRVVMIMARQHPGESPGSFVVQGKPEVDSKMALLLIFKD